MESLESRQLLSSVAVTEFSVLNAGQKVAPTGIVIGSDGHLWFSEPATDTVGVFNPSTETIVSHVSTAASQLNPTGIAADESPNGAISVYSRRGSVGNKREVPVGSN